MISETADGATSATKQTENFLMYDYMSFNDTSSNGVQFSLTLTNWDAGTVTMDLGLSTTNGLANSTNAFEISAVSFANNESLTNFTWGTAVTNYTWISSSNSLLKTARSAAITIGGSPAAFDMLTFRIRRLPVHVNDTQDGLVELLHANLHYNTQ